MNADALLSRNAEILKLLDAATRARGDGAPTERELALAAEAEANIAASRPPLPRALTGLLHLLDRPESSNGAAPFKTFVEVARAEASSACPATCRARARRARRGHTPRRSRRPLVSGVEDVDDDVPGYVHEPPTAPRSAGTKPPVACTTTAPTATSHEATRASRTSPRPRGPPRVSRGTSCPA